MLSTSKILNKAYYFMFYLFLPMLSASAFGATQAASKMKIDQDYSLLFDYKKNKTENIILIKNGREIGRVSLNIPRGRDPSKVGADNYNKPLFSKPLKASNGYAIPFLFALRTNSGDARGQCGSGVEIWLKIISVRNDSILAKRNELVQSCQYDIYLQDTGDGKIENAFQEKDGKIVIKWLSHPKGNGDGYSEVISVE